MAVVCREEVNFRRLSQSYASKPASVSHALQSRADQGVLRWFRHVERMDEYRMARRVSMEEVEGGYEVDRGQAGWMV